MKHLRLFENFDQDTYFLIDQLSNSMEFYESADEFAKFIASDTKFEEEQLKKIYDHFWAAGPEKFDVMFDFEEWLDSIDYGMVRMDEK